MKNLFDIWSQQKQTIDKCQRNTDFSDGEIWWASLGQNIASEVYGKGEDFLRPVLILRKVFNDACIVIPLTSKTKAGSYYFRFYFRNRDQYALMHQIRYLDARRLHHKYGDMKLADFRKLKTNFKNFI